MKVPVLFIIFNRLETTKKVFDSIQQYRPSHLYIAADGSRIERKEENKQCDLVRKWVLDNINWDCELKTLFQEHNLGCGKAPSTAISWFFEQEEEGIILEDDCVPHPHFFTFCEQLLPYYRNDTRISIISGCNFDTAKQFSTKESYFYSIFPYTWGWASWRRNWQDYDYHLKEWRSINKKTFLRKHLFNQKSYDLSWQQIFDGLSNDAPKHIWDYQFFYQCFKKHQLSIVPNVNLIQNIGCGEGATHTMAADNPKMYIPLQKMTFPLTHPEHFVSNKAYDIFLQELNYGVVEQIPLLKKIKRSIKKFIKSRRESVS